MGAALKGEVTLIDRDGASYKMRLDFNALAEFEAETGLNALKALQDPADLSITNVRALFWCGLRQCHPDITLETAGRMASFDSLNAAMTVSAPDASEGGAPGNARKPSRPRR